MTTVFQEISFLLYIVVFLLLYICIVLTIGTLRK